METELPVQHDTGSWRRPSIHPPLAGDRGALWEDGGAQLQGAVRGRAWMERGSLRAQRRLPESLRLGGCRVEMEAAGGALPAEAARCDAGDELFGEGNG